MNFDFDTAPDRRGTDSLKWSRYGARDVIPMWVADMDFASPPPVLEALRARVAHGVFGYTVPPDELVDIVVRRMERLYQWHIDPSWIVWLPGLVPALNIVCRAFGDDGDDVITFTPAYPPFLAAPALARKRLVETPLRREGDRFTFDVEEFARAAPPRACVLLLCHPHNPAGRRFERAELERVAEICVERNIVICSDEIHCDLILDGGRHIPTATLGADVSAHTITLMSPSKTFNTPGLNCALAIVENERLRARFRQVREGIVPPTNALGYAACLAAYRDCEDWRAALIDYLRGNQDLIHRCVNEELPGLSMDEVQATYLAWISTEGTKLTRPARFFEEHGVGLSDGVHFRGEGYVRLNFGCPRERLVVAISRLQRATAGLGG